MIYKLSTERDAFDILFWMVELAQNRWPNASVFVESEYDKAQVVSKGLNPLMYACLFPKDDILGVRLVCKNGDSIAYSSDQPDLIRLDGLPNFLEKFKDDPPECGCELWKASKALLFSVSREFEKRNVEEQLRQWFRVAQSINGGRFSLSDEDTSGHLSPVVSRYALDGYKAVIDVTISKPDGAWMLWHKSLGVVYTFGIDYSTVEMLLQNIIKSTKGE